MMITSGQLLVSTRTRHAKKSWVSIAIRDWLKYVESIVLAQCRVVFVNILSSLGLGSIDRSQFNRRSAELRQRGAPVSKTAV